MGFARICTRGSRPSSKVVGRKSVEQSTKLRIRRRGEAGLARVEKSSRSSSYPSVSKIECLIPHNSSSAPLPSRLFVCGGDISGSFRPRCFASPTLCWYAADMQGNIRNAGSEPKDGEGDELGQDRTKTRRGHPLNRSRVWRG